MIQDNLEKKSNDYGCPFFFSEVCEVEIDNTHFQDYCLNDYKGCKMYISLTNNDGENYIGSKI